MAKQRFRDIKKGRVEPQIPKEKKIYIEDDYDYASVGSKIKAFLTDAFMLVMPIMYLVFYFVMGSREEFEDNMLIGWIYIVIPLVIVQTIFMYKTGQTPGYRAYNIKLIDNTTKEKPSLGVVLFRNLSAILSLLTLLGWAVMFFRKDNRNLHDLLSATTIVNSK
ncbi:MAG: RDD family protein [Sulfurovum sp.]